jgi:hypothetical protein
MAKIFSGLQSGSMLDNFMESDGYMVMHLYLHLSSCLAGDEIC